MQSKGRPPVREIKLADGFYIEVRNKGSKEKGIKIKTTSKESMLQVANQYSKNKDVTILGEYRNEKWIPG